MRRRSPTGSRPRGCGTRARPARTRPRRTTGTLSVSCGVAPHHPSPTGGRALAPPVWPARCARTSTSPARWARSIAHEKAAAFFAVHGLVERQLADAVDLDRREGQVASLAGGTDEARDGDSPEPRPQLVVFGPQVVRHRAGRLAAFGPDGRELRGQFRLGLGQRGAEPIALGLEPIALAGELGPLGVDRLDELHDLQLVVLQLADAPADRRHVVLQRLQLTRVRHRSRVELLLGLVGPFAQGRDLVLQALLAPGQLVAPPLDVGELAIDGNDVVLYLREVGPDLQRLHPVVELVGAGVVFLDGEEGGPTAHQPATLSGVAGFPAISPDPQVHRPGGRAGGPGRAAGGGAGPPAGPAEAGAPTGRCLAARPACGRRARAAPRRTGRSDVPRATPA